jgi:mxaL protein
MSASRSRAPDRSLRLLYLAAALLVAAALQPTIELPRRVLSVLFVVDLSQSMNTPDVRLGDHNVSRLELARQALHDALRELPCGTRAGIGLFADSQTVVLYDPVEICSHFTELTDTIGHLSSRAAWAPNSQIAKGIHSSLKIAAQLGPGIDLVFLTDGHEAPPVSPRRRPSFDAEPGAVHGVLVGVGGRTPQPIPKLDAEGRIVGQWDAREVLQRDPYSIGRAGTSGIDALAETEPQPDPAIAARLGATPGREHLSSLREGYLQLLAEELRLDYHRLADGKALATALKHAKGGTVKQTPTDIGHWLAAAALLLIAAAHRPMGS